MTLPHAAPFFALYTLFGLSAVAGLPACVAQDPGRSRLAPPTAQTQPLDEADLNERVTPVVKAVRRARDSVASIYILTRDQREAAFRGTNLQGQGSGVIVDATGLVITNWHVIATAAAQPETEAIQARLTDGRNYKARLLNLSRENDLALLQLELPAGEEVKPATLGDSESLMIGETLIGIGNPQGHANTVTTGVLSASDRSIRARTPDGSVLDFHGLLQTDAAINQGNSGGGLFDITGRLVGINNAMMANAENIGFAIPVNRVQRVFQELLVGSASFSLWLGLRIDEKAGALTVAAIDAGGPAARAGLRPGDRLVAAGGRKVESSVEYARALLGARSGTPFALAVERNGREVRAEAVPQPRAAGIAHAAVGATFEEVSDDRGLLRRASEAFSDGLRRAYPLARVLRVQSVTEGAPAAELGIKPGDVLLYLSERSVYGRVARRPFESLEGLAAALQSASGGELGIALLREGEGVLEGKLPIR